MMFGFFLWGRVRADKYSVVSVRREFMDNLLERLLCDGKKGNELRPAYQLLGDGRNKPGSGSET